MMIRVRDFQQIRRRIERMAPKPESLASVYWALFGAAVASGAGIAPLYTVSDLPAWVIPAYFLGTGSFIVLGLILVFVDQALKRGRTVATAELVQEMKHLEKIYHGKAGAAAPRQSEHAQPSASDIKFTLDSEDESDSPESDTDADVGSVLLLAPGDRVRHATFGTGTVLQVGKCGIRAESKVDFGKQVGIKHLINRYAPMEKL